jgi:LytS/YehU family sensor histidine kinase
MMQKQKKLAIHYLTTFSKLMRILLQNSDKPFVSLLTELETCQHYTEIEEIRMDNKLSSEFTVDPTIDQHSIKIPALSIQSFIEKAIYYRIRPAGEGVLSVTVANEGDKIVCDVRDSGVNRKAYLQEKKEGGRDIKELNLTQREGITETRWFKENTSVEVFETLNETGNLPGTTVQLTFKAYNDDKDSID